MTLLEWMSASWRRTTPVPERGTAVALGGGRDGRTNLIVDYLADAVPANDATP